MDKTKRKMVKKEYKENPQKVKNLMRWKRDPKTVDKCPICDKSFSKHSLKEMHVCEDKAFENIERAKEDLEIVISNWGKSGTICAVLLSNLKEIKNDKKR